ncbi:MAG TPA: metal-dependent hydrolase [Gemmatimonadaceae bacterium]|jgi:membrane-bound metal-dependent hydrolase YbcI (DUF457 family)
MFLGHYGVAFAAKRVEPRVSLGAFGFAAQFLDEVWPILVLAGVEHVRPAPGLMPASQLDFVSYPVSHSLLMSVVWGVLIGAVYFAIRRYRRGAILLGLTVVSHWVLDLPMHRADLPLWPGSSVVVGWGAWRSIPLTLLLDGGTFLVGLVLYLRASRARDRVGSWALWSLVVVLVAIYLGGTFGSPPATERAIAMGALPLWLVVLWMLWIDRHRVMLGQPSAQG